MKKIFVSITALVFSVFLWQCGNDGVTPEPGQPVQVSADIAARTTDFAFDFFKKFQATQPANENIFVSPLSLHMALGMLLNGAEGETAQQISKSLKMEGVSQADLNQAYQALLEGLPKADPKVQLGLANSVWYRNTFKVEDNFLNVLRQSFDAEVAGLNFDDPNAKDKINAWASDKTNGKIKKVIDQIKPSDVLFLMNALYFKGDWQIQFDPNKTSDAPFLLADDGEKTVKMMRVKEKFKVTQRNDFAAVQLPYAAGNFNLTLLIPGPNSQVDKVIEGLSASTWNELQTAMREQQVTVGLPRFTLEYDAKLNDVLQTMGMARAFSNQAELGKINPTADLFVSLVKQNTYLGIDEKGTEAAAVTTVGVGLTSVPVEPYVADHPFVLIISEKTSNTILFMGKIMNP
ncbi:serpin family protein [Persicitalea jodogahamensis]|uniref:Serpin n=1 Tax=Persicitalea jodogahamensis TaxID=402147 RepID=A0A8J3D2A2_9BACT|nr:serpin family protein [Persicitalea jodogahamensis]GHB52897.1 serpin [Persicitalea jodogahamensis]